MACDTMLPCTTYGVLNAGLPGRRVLCLYALISMQVLRITGPKDTAKVMAESSNPRRVEDMGSLDMVLGRPTMDTGRVAPHRKVERAGTDTAEGEGQMSRGAWPLERVALYVCV